MRAKRKLMTRLAAGELGGRRELAQGRAGKPISFTTLSDRCPHRS